MKIQDCICESCTFSLLVSGDFNVTFICQGIAPAELIPFSLLVSGDFNVTCVPKHRPLHPGNFQSPSKRRFQCNMEVCNMSKEITIIFQSPSKRRFQCNVLHGFVAQNTLSFQSPSKRRFQCNSIFFYIYFCMDYLSVS